MISQEYLHLEPLEQYTPLLKDSVILGTRIKNRYDEKRIKIDKKYNPSRFTYNKNGDKFYGTPLTCPVKLLPLLEKLKTKRPFDLIGYSQLLEEYGLTCNNEFYKLNNQYFPVDYQHVTQFLPEYEYSSYLCLDSDSAGFQNYAQPELVIIFID